MMGERLPDQVVNEARDMACIDVAIQHGFKYKKRIGSTANCEWIGPCPGCGGDDRFSVHTGKNVWNCGHMGGDGGDAIALQMHITGENFTEAVKSLTHYTGNKEPRRSIQRKPEKWISPNSNSGSDNAWRDRARRNAYNLWCGARPMGDLIRSYFKCRNISFPDWRIKTLREIEKLDYWHAGGGSQRSQIIHSGPAMVAAITDDDGKFIGIHRTWLDLTSLNGRAHISCPDTGEVLDGKKVLGSQKGGRIVLRDVRDVRKDPDETFDLVVGEGIETVLSYAELKGNHTAALWSGVNLGNIAGRAAGSVAHPTMKFIDKRQRERKRRVPSDVPLMEDQNCLRIPKMAAGVIYLGDGDSDPFSTRNAMRRAAIRAAYQAPDHRSVETAFAPLSDDFNDVLSRQKCGVDA